MSDQEYRLTSYSHGSGCGCKIAPAVLDEILKCDTAAPLFDKLVVGNEGRDDAAVLDIGNGQGLISTTDFFMPVVDDAYDFGRIAATNAISDVYAMGGKPVMALAILGWPIDKLPASLAHATLEGGRAICSQAGIPLAGGHTIDSPEPIFGLSVNGMVDLNHLKKNNTVKEGDLLFLTKPIGLGIMSAAMKRSKAATTDVDEMVQWMTTLNTFGAIAAKHAYVHAMTDVTGFGLFGHLLEMVEGTGFSAEITMEKVPLLTNLQSYIDQFIFPDMTTRNFNSYGQKITELSAKNLFTGCDPQTSGGLLIAVDPAYEKDFIRLAAEYGLSAIVREPVGRIIARDDKVLVVK